MSKASQKKQDLQVIYNYVIDDVIAKVKPEFLGNGVDE